MQMTFCFPAVQSYVTSFVCAHMGVRIRRTKPYECLAKRLQHFNATSCNIVEHNMLHTFGHPVAIGCDMLQHVG